MTQVPLSRDVCAARPLPPLIIFNKPPSLPSSLLLASDNRTLFFLFFLKTNPPDEHSNKWRNVANSVCRGVSHPPTLLSYANYLLRLINNNKRIKMEGETSLSTQILELLRRKSETLLKKRREYYHSHPTKISIHCNFSKK